ncbi:hypothetical protein DFJ74DRAFT_602821 [Hyaloraphidium curvatum]|nr:hypothetical protein DFJ74DRAFT_602821 [Hyaloraphidium curvatum]
MPYYGTPAALLQPTLRTVYLGNLPRGTAVEDILNHVRHGALESCKILEDKGCAFVTFLDPAAASMFHHDASTRRLAVLGQELKVGWGKPTSPPPAHVLAALQNGATRVVFIGNIDSNFTNAFLREEFARFGTVDTVRVIPDKRIAFVHMASVANAVRAVTALQVDERWANKRVNFGKDRCMPNFRFMAAGMVPPPMGIPGMPMAMPYAYPQPVQPWAPQANGGQNAQAQPSVGPNGVVNRTVYLGGIHADTVLKELCDHIRGGILQNIKYLPDKGIAFVTFISPDGAAAFHNRAASEGLIIHGKRIKIGWGKTQPMPPVVMNAVSNGATRNVYVGNVDLETFPEEEIRREFETFGEIELLNTVPEKSIAFVNFADILSAITAVETKRNDPAWSSYRINFGKDRCGNAPRPPTNAPAPSRKAGGTPDDARTRTPPATNGSSSPPPGPRPVLLSAFLTAPPKHQRSHSHQIRPAQPPADAENGAAGGGRPSSAQGGEGFSRRHRHRKSQNSNAGSNAAGNA